MIFAEQETNFHANLGTDEIVALQKQVHARHPGISAADLYVTHCTTAFVSAVCIYAVS